MSKVPPLSGHECIRKLKKLGFDVIRQRGSHVVLQHDDGRVTVVPCHKGHDLDTGLIRKILKDAKVTSEEFNKI